MGIHRAVTAGDDVEEMPIGGTARPLIMQARGFGKAALHHDARAGSDAVVTWRAINVVFSPAAAKQFGGDFGASRHFLRARQVSACHGAWDWRLQHLAVAEQAARLVLVILRLRIHVGARAASEREGDQQRRT
jgi:hypothetical protein